MMAHTKTKLLIEAAGITAAAVVGLLLTGGVAAADGHNATGSDPSAPPAQNLPVSTYPAAPQNLPVATYPVPYDQLKNLPVSSYPASPSWPGMGWGVED